MKRWSAFTLTAALAIFVNAGCSTLQSMPGKMRALISRQPDAADPLAAVTKKTHVSDDFKTAKRELKSADETLLKYAQLREDMGDHSVALDRYRELLADNPDNISARLGIARVEYKTGRVHEAEQILKATARIYPDNQQVWIDMGRIQSERKQFGAAIQSLNKAVSLDSASQVARFELGLAMARGDRLDEAKGHLSFAVGNSGALYNIGYVLHEAGRNDEAMHWFKQALDSYPDERTRKTATDMIAMLNGNSGFSDGARLASARRIPSKVDIEQTSYEEWKEAPSKDGTLQRVNSRRLDANNAKNFGGQSPGRQTVVQPTRKRQSPLRRVSHASPPASDMPDWKTAQPALRGTVPVISPEAPSEASGKPMAADANDPPQWRPASDK